MMALAKQLLDTLGLGDGGDHWISRTERWGRRTSRDLPRAARRWRRQAAAQMPREVPTLYLWLGAAALASAAVVLLARRWPRGRSVGDVMIGEVVTIEPWATLMEAAQKMREANVGVLPVVESGRLRGILTDRDLVVRGMARGADPSSTQVRDCATPDLVCARPDTGVEEAMGMMADAQVGRLPVVDERNRLVGIVTLSSLAFRSRDEEEAFETAQEVSRRSARSA